MSEHRFSRIEMVLGTNNLERLAKTTVAIVGLGGVGGYVAEALARSGVGSLVLIDHDIVAESNLNRQIVALESTIGKPKVEVMAERIHQINPACQLYIFKEFYHSENHAHLINDRVDYVADAIDSVGPKLALITRCTAKRLPIISALGAGNKLDPSQLTITDISKTHTCALARVVRAGLRKRGIGMGVPVVFSPEQNKAQIKGSVPGSTAFVPPAAGLLMASWIVRQICEEEQDGSV